MPKLTEAQICEIRHGELHHHHPLNHNENDFFTDETGLKKRDINMCVIIPSPSFSVLPVLLKEESGSPVTIMEIRRRVENLRVRRQMGGEPLCIGFGAF